MRRLVVLVSFTACINAYAQKEDMSLFMKRDKDAYLDKVELRSGNLFFKWYHPVHAIENVWI